LWRVSSTDMTAVIVNVRNDVSIREEYSGITAPPPHRSLSLQARKLRCTRKPIGLNCWSNAVEFSRTSYLI